MYQIKFGTDGWREIIGDNYTTANVRRVASATAQWLKSANLDNSCVIGYDCRFGGEMFAKETAVTFASMGIVVHLSNGFVSTPMISLGVSRKQLGLGIIITASHNPPSYNGFKIKANYGGPATPDVINEIEALITNTEIPSQNSFDEYIESGVIQYIDLEKMYIDHCKEHFNIEALEKISNQLAYDSMYGAGQNVIRELLPKSTLLHCEFNPGFNGRAPEPILKNLPEISEMIKSSEELKIGLATDGDADRIGFFDEFGNFVDSHHIILLLIEYLTDYKKLSGSVVKSFSVSDKVDLLCEQKGIKSITTKIGFKYICEYMINEDVLIGAEESGGIAIKGHIPERDGIWMGLVLMEYASLAKKTISELIQDVYAKVGSFAVERYDLHVTNEIKNAIINSCKNREYSSFGPYNITSVEDLDGFKFRLSNGNWVMIRPSGTEPVLRVYAEAENSQLAYDVLNFTKKIILNE